MLLIKRALVGKWFSPGCPVSSSLAAPSYSNFTYQSRAQGAFQESRLTAQHSTIWKNCTPQAANHSGRDSRTIQMQGGFFPFSLVSPVRFSVPLLSSPLLSYVPVEVNLLPAMLYLWWAYIYNTELYTCKSSAAQYYIFVQFLMNGIWRDLDYWTI